MLPMKTQKEIYNKQVDIQTWIENLLDRKIKCICSERELNSNAFDAWFKTIVTN